MRRSVGLAAVALVLAVPTVPAQFSEGEAKMDAPLLGVLHNDPEWARWTDGRGRVDVLLIGPEHALPETLPAARDAWNEHWSRHAAPFVAEVLRALDPAAGDEHVATLATAPWVKVRATPERAAELASLPGVRIAALDWPEAVRILETVEAPGILMDESVPMTGAFGVHALGFQGQGVKLAMIDTGIEHLHPAFLDEYGNSRVTAWFDATSAGCATPCDTNGHGTHTAATAAGSTIAGGRHQGVAPRAEIYGVKIFIGGSGTWEDAQEGLQGAFDLGADITSNSWGGGCSGGGLVAEEVARNLALAGMQSVFAAGNNGAGSAGGLCPGRNDLVLSVAAVDKAKVVAGFSSGGPCPDAGGFLTRVCPDVSAVGVDVEAAYIGGGYSSLSGTSMATPHVAGAGALMMQMRRALHDAGYDVPSEELEQFFEAHAEDLGPAGNDNRYGWGFIGLQPMADALLAGAQARVIVDVIVGLPEMRRTGTNTATLVVTNAGPRPVAGTATVAAGGELEHDVLEYGREPVALAPGESTTVEVTIPGTDLDPTTYHVVGAYEYEYTSDDAGTVSATVEDFAAFLVRGVRFKFARAGLPDPARTANFYTVALTARNVGNEPASAVEIREGVPLPGFLLEARVTASNPPFGTMSTPPPVLVTLDPLTQTTVLHYTAATLDPGSAISALYRTRALAAGTWSFVGGATYTDAVGDTYTTADADPHTVTGPG